MSNGFKILSIFATLLVIIALQWHALSNLRQEDKTLQQRVAEAEKARLESPSQRQSNPQPQSTDDFLASEVMRLRAQVLSLQDKLGQATNRAAQLILTPEQLPLAFRGNADLPRRVLPQTGPMPRDFDQYRIQMRYTGLTTVLQRREGDGSYTDVIEGPREIGLGDKQMFVLCWPDPSRMSGTWVFIDLDTGQVREEDSTSFDEIPYNTPEGKAAKWIKRDIPDPNDPSQNWKVLFK